MSKVLDAMALSEAHREIDTLKCELDRAKTLVVHALSEFQSRECNCDAEVVDGRYVGSACYFHRIEADLRSIAKAEVRG